jgi:hypothetical protein
MTPIIDANPRTLSIEPGQLAGDGLSQDNPSIEEIVARARAALERLSRSFEDWLDLGEAVQLARTEAMRTAGTNKPRGKKYQRAVAAWLQEHKLGGIDKAARSRLLNILKHRAEITEWRNDPKNSEAQRFNHPNKVFDAWKKWKAEQAGFNLEELKKPSAMAKLKDANIELQERLHRAEQEIKRGGGDLWNQHDRPEDIADIMVAKLTSAKAERVARAILAKLKKKKNAAPSQSKQDGNVEDPEISAAERKRDYAELEGA